MSPRPKVKIPKRKKKKKSSKFLYFLEVLILSGIIIGAVSTGMFLLWATTLKMPDIQSFGQRKVAQSTKIYDRTGEILLFDLHENIQRTLVPFNDISIHIKNAAVAIEDVEFYEHFGVKPLAFLRAVLANIQTGRFSQGGSTITQQVIKNSILTSEKKIARKLKEWVLAVKLEKTLTKDQILELYLNESPYGGSIYGIEEASRRFFGKSATDVTLAEAAYLAALPQAPTYYSPYGSNRDALDRRKDLVLHKMYENKFITSEEYGEALSEIVTFGVQADIGIKAPHFVMYVREYLAEKYGERAIEERGFRIITTLDYELQKEAEDIIASYAETNEENFDATNASLVAVDPKTGQILVMVGSRDYFDEEIDGNFNIATAERQPGSAFKPFVYATALEKGYTTETIVFDVPTQFSTNCEVDKFESDEDCYSPGNYDGKYHGPITMRDALAQSVNIPAVKFMYLAGLRDSLQTAKAMGIDTLTDIGTYGLTLVLGGGEVSLLDITSAYGVFANEGTRNPHTGILKIEDSSGQLVEEFRQSPNRVLDKQIALKITNMLSDNSARTPAFGARSPLYFANRDVAAKTGTTNDYRDAWIVGYTPSIAVGAWAGNNDNSPMQKKVAGFTVAPMWNAFMWKALVKMEEVKFRSPLGESGNLKPILKGVSEGGTSYFIDKISGKLATEFTPPETKEERFINDMHSILHWVKKDDPRGPAPEKPESDPQYKYWEYGVNKWKLENGLFIGTSSTSTVLIPTEFDDIHKPEYRPIINVVNFDSNRVYEQNEMINVQIVIDKKEYPIQKVDYYINDVFVETKNSGEFNFTFKPSSQTLSSSSNSLKIVAYDEVFNKSETIVPFKINF
jgi:1A family penicillin-binding protein